MTSLRVGGVEFLKYAQLFKDIVDKLEAMIEEDRPKAIEILKRAASALLEIRRHPESDIGQTVLVLHERIDFLNTERLLIPIRAEFMTLAEDLQRFGIPDEAWPAIRAITSRFSSESEKLKALRYSLTVNPNRAGGPKPDYKRHIALLIAAELYEAINNHTPKVDKHFLDFCTMIFDELGLADPKYTDNLANFARRNLRKARA